MRTLVFAAIATLIVGIGYANAETQTYRAPAHNYHQNNWMGGGGG